MDLGFDVVVTITGIVLVFLILVLLMTIITLEGKIFDSMGTKKRPQRKPPRLPPQSPLHPCSRPQPLPLLRWKRASPAMWSLPLWLRSTQWATASTPSRPCAAARTAGAMRA